MSANISDITCLRSRQ